jgi:cell division protein FtsQ
MDTLQAAAPLPPDIRWMRRAALALLGLGVLLGLAMLLSRVAQSARFDWRQMRIEGDLTHNSEAQLRANTLPRLQGNFLSTPLSEVREAFEAVPWVRRARVQRVWPGQLLVTLQEHRAEALWDGRGEYGEPPLERAILGGDAEVFHANLGEVEDLDLPLLAGPSGSESAVLALWRRLASVARAHQREVTRLELSGRGSWRLQLDGGVAVELGRGESEAVASRFERFLPHASSVARRFHTQLQSADLRHDGGYALRLVGITTQPNPDKKARKP